MKQEDIDALKDIKKRLKVIQTSLEEQFLGRVAIMKSGLYKGRRGFIASVYLAPDVEPGISFLVRVPRVDRHGVLNEKADARKFWRHTDLDILDEYEVCEVCEKQLDHKQRTFYRMHANCFYGRMNKE